MVTQLRSSGGALGLGTIMVVGKRLLRVGSDDRSLWLGYVVTHVDRSSWIGAGV